MRELEYVYDEMRRVLENLNEWAERIVNTTLNMWGCVFYIAYC